MAQKCSASLVIREMQIKRTLRFPLQPSEWLRSKTWMTAHAGEDVEKEEHSSISSEIANLFNNSGDQSILRKLERVLPEDLAIPLLRIPKRSSIITQGYLLYVHSNFIHNSLNWKQPKWPSTGNRYRKCDPFNWNGIHSGIFIKIKGIMYFASKCMEVENFLLSEVIQDKHDVYLLICGY